MSDTLASEIASSIKISSAFRNLVGGEVIRSNLIPYVAAVIDGKGVNEAFLKAAKGMFQEGFAYGEQAYFVIRCEMEDIAREVDTAVRRKARGIEIT